jgi:hypothetical protein
MKILIGYPQFIFNLLKWGQTCLLTKNKKIAQSTLAVDQDKDSNFRNYVLKQYEVSWEGKSKPKDGRVLYDDNKINF